MQKSLPLLHIAEGKRVIPHPLAVVLRDRL